MKKRRTRAQLDAIYLAKEARAAEKSRLPGWDFIILHVRVAKHGDRAISVTVARHSARRWSASVVQSAVGARSLTAVFDAHAHHVIGERFRTPTGAQRAGDRYIRAWLKKRKDEARCACKPISRPRPSRRTGARAPRQAARRPRS